MSTSRTATPDSHELNSAIQRCRHTLLTKPECHCRACLFEQIAVHGKRPAQAVLARDRAAA
jgi:hypothetical protein